MSKSIPSFHVRRQRDGGQADVGKHRILEHPISRRSTHSPGKQAVKVGFPPFTNAGKQPEPASVLSVYGSAGNKTKQEPGSPSQV